MSRRVAISTAALGRLGWTRVDPQPRSKCRARWRHVDGWRLEHCGHPTANTPWALFDAAGEMIRTGVMVGNPPTFGTAWPDLRTAAEWLAAHLEARTGRAGGNVGSVHSTRSGRGATGRPSRQGSPVLPSARPVDAST